MYLVFKLLHVLAVIVFIGNITVGLFWKEIADRTRDQAIVAHTIGGIIRADRLFTVPAVILVVVGGVGAAITGQIPILQTGWLLWGIILFVIAGIAFGPVSRIQRQMLAAAKDADWVSYERLTKGWNLWGTIALIAPLLATALMILKPALPALPM